MSENNNTTQETESTAQTRIKELVIGEDRELVACDQLHPDAYTVQPWVKNMQRARTQAAAQAMLEDLKAEAVNGLIVADKTRKLVYSEKPKPVFELSVLERYFGGGDEQ